MPMLAMGSSEQHLWGPYLYDKLKKSPAKLSGIDFGHEKSWQNNVTLIFTSASIPKSQIVTKSFGKNVAHNLSLLHGSKCVQASSIWVYAMVCVQGYAGRPAAEPQCGGRVFFLNLAHIGRFGRQRFRNAFSSMAAGPYWLPSQ